MTIKVKHILLLLLVVIVILVLKDPIIYRIKVYILEKKVVDFYNGKDVKGVTEGSYIGRKYAKEEIPEKYDVTEFVNNVILQIDNSKLCIEQNKEPEKIETVNIYKGNDIYQFTSDYQKHIINNMNKDINVDRYNTFDSTIISQKDDRWFIYSNSPSIIELSYGLYCKYIRSDKQINKNIIKITNCKLTEKTDFIKGVHCIISYLDINGDEQEKKYIINFDNSDGKTKYILSSSKFLYDEKNHASIRLGSYDADDLTEKYDIIAEAADRRNKGLITEEEFDTIRESLHLPY